MNKKNYSGCLGYIGDEILPSYVGVIINHYKDPINHWVQGNVITVLKVAQLRRFADIQLRSVFFLSCRNYSHTHTHCRWMVDRDSLHPQNRIHPFPLLMNFLRRYLAFLLGFSFEVRFQASTQAMIAMLPSKYCGQMRRNLTNTSPWDLIGHVKENEEKNGGRPSFIVVF